MSKKKITVTNNLTPKNIDGFIEKLGREISDLANRRASLIIATRFDKKKTLKLKFT